MCHFHKYILITLIIYKNDKRLVTLYNVIIANMSRSCHIWVISSINTRGQYCATEMKCTGKLICLTKLIHKLLFLQKHRDKTSVWTKWDTNQEPTMAIQILLPIRSAYLLPARQDGVVILPASLSIIICQLAYPISWQVSNQQHSLMFELNEMAEILWRSVGRNVQWSQWAWSISLNFMIQLSC